MRRRLAALAGVAAVLAAACGTSEPPAAIPVQVAQLSAPPGFTIAEEDGVDERLARAGDDALIGAARLWRLEQNGRVVGATQIATWSPAIRDEDEARATLLAAVHTGRPDQRQIHGVAVDVSAQPGEPGDARPGLTRASWFTPTGFALLTLRDDLDIDAVLAQVVAATTGGAQ